MTQTPALKTPAVSDHFKYLLPPGLGFLKIRVPFRFKFRGQPICCNFLTPFPPIRCNLVVALCLRALSINSWRPLPLVFTLCHLPIPYSPNCPTPHPSWPRDPRPSHKAPFSLSPLPLPLAPSAGTTAGDTSPCLCLRSHPCGQHPCWNKTSCVARWVWRIALWQQTKKS